MSQVSSAARTLGIVAVLSIGATASSAASAQALGPTRALAERTTATAERTAATTEAQARAVERQTAQAAAAGQPATAARDAPVAQAPATQAPARAAAPQRARTTPAATPPRARTAPAASQTVTRYTPFPVPSPPWNARWQRHRVGPKAYVDPALRAVFQSGRVDRTAPEAGRIGWWSVLGGSGCSVHANYADGTSVRLDFGDGRGVLQIANDRWTSVGQGAPVPLTISLDNERWDVAGTGADGGKLSAVLNDPTFLRHFTQRHAMVVTREGRELLRVSLQDAGRAVAETADCSREGPAFR